MGIFRLGFNKIWKTEFFEKKNNELPLYIFKDLEIRNYIERFLKIHGIILNDYKQYYKNSTLNLVSTNKIEEKVIIKSDSKKKVVKNVHNVFLSLELEGIFREIFEVLNLFTNNKLNIIINFCCLNKDLHFLKTTQKKTFMSLQKFKNTPFFKEGISILFYVTHKSCSANLLAQFIVFQLKKTKRHKFFLSFLNQTLIILLNSSLSQIKGIKIIIKGRLNGVSRAKQKTILIGDVPVQTISAKLDYIQTTTHNSTGSYGIKIWVVEK